MRVAGEKRYLSSEHGGSTAGNARAAPQILPVQCTLVDRQQQLDCGAAHQVCLQARKQKIQNTSLIK